MGNRAVIVSKDTTKSNANKKVGIYVHWYGNKEDVQRALDKAKELHVRSVTADTTYFWARFCQVFANIITEDYKNSMFESNFDQAYTTGIGIGIVSQLDCHNCDNGVYYIDDNFKIVKQTSGAELED